MDRKSLTKTFVASGAKTGAVEGATITVEHYTEIALFFRCTAVSGTSPTMDFKVQMSPDGSNWHTVSSVTQITAAVTLAPVQLTNIGKYMRVYAAAPGGSSTPTVTMADIIGVLKN